MLRDSVELTLNETNHKADITRQCSGSPINPAPADLCVMQQIEQELMRPYNVPYFGIASYLKSLI